MVTYQIRELKRPVQPWVMFEIRDEHGGVRESLRIIGGESNTVEYWTVDDTGSSKVVQFDGELLLM